LLAIWSGGGGGGESNPSSGNGKEGGFWRCVRRRRFLRFRDPVATPPGRNGISMVGLGPSFFPDWAFKPALRREHTAVRGERTGGQRAQTTTSTMERHPKDLTLLVRSTKPNPCFINNNNNNAVKPANTASNPNSCRC
jgi:hypothetical protein